MASPSSHALNQVVRLFERGRLEEAAAACAAIVAAQPRNFDAMYFLGVIRGNQQRLAEAAHCFETAAALQPRSFAVHRNLGIAWGGLGRREAAIASFERALSLNPGDAATHGDLGAMLAESGQLDRALASFERAVALAPESPDALNNIGAALSALGRHEEAIAHFRRLVALRPRDPDAHSNLGAALNGTRRHDDAVLSCRRALALDTDHLPALNGLGAALAGSGQHEAALACFERALAVQPEDADAAVNAANALKSLKRYDAALARSGAVMARRPDDLAALTLCASLRRFVCAWPGLESIDARVIAAVRDAGAGVLPFVFITISDDPALQAVNARRYWRQRRVAAPALGERPPVAREKIRLGYLSADFHEHATARLAAELFELHDRARFEVVAFSSGPDDGSPMRRRLERAFDAFHDIRGAGDAAAAARIRDDKIDILVDLKGHTEDNRLEILARRPAPLQAHYLGYPGTLGVEFVDYLIADRFVAPPQTAQFFAEKLVYLPHSYQINDRRRPMGETPTRGECGLPEIGFVFCCFNNSYKITPTVFDVWMRLLKALPESVLWLLADNGVAEENLRREAAGRGIGPERLVFAPRLPLAHHLARHRLADLFLDTVPVNAHTTASDALWAGLPLLTCAGRSFVARVAGSLLRAVGLPELVTDDLPSYEACALSLARDPDRLAAIRTKLAAGRASAALFDADRTRRHLEAAYAAMWDIRCRGESPRPIDIPALA